MTPIRRTRRASLLVGASLVLLLASAAPAFAIEETNPAPLGGTPSPTIPIVTCFGVPVEIWVPVGGVPYYGDDYDNVIMGTGGPDIIWGGGGIDRICQPDGDESNLLDLGPAVTDGIDVVHGDGGGDYIDGGSDGDQLYGDIGEDFLHGGDGNDVLNGGAQDDRLYGEADDDGLTCGGGFDKAYGGPGNDFLAPSAPQAECNVFVS